MFCIVYLFWALIGPNTCTTRPIQGSHAVRSWEKFMVHYSGGVCDIFGADVLPVTFSNCCCCQKLFARSARGLICDISHVGRCAATGYVQSDTCIKFDCLFVVCSIWVCSWRVVACLVLIRSCLTSPSAKSDVWTGVYGITCVCAALLFYPLPFHHGYNTTTQMQFSPVRWGYMIARVAIIGILFLLGKRSAFHYHNQMMRIWSALFISIPR